LYNNFKNYQVKKKLSPIFRLAKTVGNLPEDGDREGLGQREDLPDARQGPTLVRKHDQKSKRR
jgi:hypothetical protein